MGDSNFFKVLPSNASLPSSAKSKAILLTDEWNDWYKYKTQYTLFVFDEDGAKHTIGSVKIGQFGMKEGQLRPDLPEEFDDLGTEFFSLGQDDSYYENLNSLGPRLREQILLGLRDVALDLGHFERALEEKVTGVSLLRYVTQGAVRGQFNRMAKGGARLSRYEFTYKGPNLPKSDRAPVSLEFIVEPESSPPTNIHVLIGRNGVGKTRLLNNMTRALVMENADPSEVGHFESSDENLFEDNIFAGLVSVTFSAFDPFEPLPSRQDKSKGIQYAYIGLKRIGKATDGKPLAPKSPESLSREFGQSVLICRQGARVGRWRHALEMLEADPIFREAGVTELASEDLEEADLKVLARKLFERLSSGHKIVLLTITRLVETVEERTLVLLDEPEAHLHPPLLSAFVRALSDLLMNRNGVAIIATHSPVVLQEVPKSCAWKVRRSGSRVDADRPEIETFGENVGILTREIFGLEVTQSGFHKLLQDAVNRDRDYDEIVRQFGGELGGEAKAIIRALIEARTTETEE